jgi:hypothetical protein
MRFAGLVIALSLLVACNQTAESSPTVGELPTPVAVTPLANVTPVLPFTPATHRDAEAGFELQYPTEWFILGGEMQSRSAYVQIASWDPGPNGITEILSGESVLQITIYQWEPTHDLDARVQMRRNNLLDSGNTILEEEELEFSGARVVRFLLQGTDGVQALFFFAELGDRYLELSGTGDIATLDAAARTLVIDEPAQ